MNADKFFQETVIPTLKEIKSELKTDKEKKYKEISIERKMIEPPDNSVIMTMAWGAKLSDANRYMKELLYIFSVNTNTLEARSELSLQEVGSIQEKIHYDNINKHINDISSKDIRSDFYKAYNQYIQKQQVRISFMEREL